MEKNTKKRKKKRNVSLNVVQIDNRDVVFLWESANSGYSPAPSSSIGWSDKTANQVNQTSSWLRKLLPWRLIGGHFLVCVSWLVKTSHMGCDEQHYRRWCYIDILLISFYGLWWWLTERRAIWIWIHSLWLASSERWKEGGEVEGRRRGRHCWVWALV